MPGAKQPSKILRTLALRQADVEETVACKGTAVESSAFKVGKKTFLFARDVQMMVKLEASLAEAKKHAAKDPDHYQAGAGGWVTVKFEGGAVPPQELLARWIAESYRLMAGSGSAKAAKKSKSH